MTPALPDLNKWLDYLENRSKDALAMLQLSIAFIAAIPAGLVTATGQSLSDPVLGSVVLVSLLVVLLILSDMLVQALVDRAAYLFLSRLVLGGFLPRNPDVFTAHEVLLGHL